MNIPQISVVMSVFNGQEFLAESISSILTQTFSNFEFIIINDGSTDDSKSIIASINDERIISFDQPNQGLACALNFGIRNAKGRYIARLDADDIALPTRLRKQFEFLELNNDYALIGSNAKIIDYKGNFVYESDYPTNWQDIICLAPNFPLFHSSVMFRKEIAINAGLYNEQISKLGVFEDLLLWNEMIKFGKIGNLKEALILYRLSPSASTAKIGKLAETAKRLLFSALKNKSLSNEEIIEYLKVKEKFKQNNNNEFIYHKYLAKKYLLNGKNTSKAKEHLQLAKNIRNNDLELTLYYILTFIPASLRQPIYNKLRKIKQGIS